MVRQRIDALRLLTRRGFGALLVGSLCFGPMAPRARATTYTINDTTDGTNAASTAGQVRFAWSGTDNDEDNDDANDGAIFSAGNDTLNFTATGAYAINAGDFASHPGGVQGSNETLNVGGVLVATLNGDTGTRVAFNSTDAAFGMTKSGTGTLALNVVTNLTGTFTVNAGTVRFADTGADRNIFNDAMPVVLTGTSTLDVNGTVETIGSLSSASATTVLGLGVGNLTVAETGSNTFLGSITGATGTLTKAGAGTLEINNAASVYGNTVITGGTLAVNNIGDLGTTGITFNGAGSTLRLDAAFGVTRAVGLTTDGVVNTGGFSSSFSGAITGTGSLVKDGTGVLTLTNDANAYGTGGGEGLVIADGTVIANSAGSLDGVITFDEAQGTDGVNTADNVLQLGAAFGAALVNNIAVTTAGTFNTGGNSVTLSGVISGGSVLDRLGAGVVTLTGASGGFTGTFDNNVGTVSLGTAAAGGALGGTFNNLANATLIGQGTMGILANSGTLSPGFSAGLITVTDLNLNPDGLGTGNYITEVFADGTNDRINATNDVNLGGTLTVQGETTKQGDYFGRSFTIITADSDASGAGTVNANRFSVINDNFALLNPTVSVIDNAVGTDFVNVSFDRFAVNLEDLAAPGNVNQANVARAVQQVMTSGQADTDFRSFFSTLVTLDDTDRFIQRDGLAGTNFEDALQQLAGENRTAAIRASLGNNALLTGRVVSQLQSSTMFAADLEPESGDEEEEEEESEETAATAPMASFSMASAASAFGVAPSVGGLASGSITDQRTSDDASVWVLGSGLWGDIDPTAVNQSFDYDGSGFVLGYTGGDSKGNSDWRWGVHGGFSDVDIETDGREDKTEVDSWSAGVHAAYFKEGCYANAVAGYVNNEYQSQQILEFGGLSRNARAEFDGDEAFAYAEIGKIFDLGSVYEDVETTTRTTKKIVRTPEEEELVEEAPKGKHDKKTHKDHMRDHKAVKEVAEVETEVTETVETETVTMDTGEGWHAQPQLALQYRDFGQDAYTQTGAGALNQVVQEQDLEMFQAALGGRLYYTGRTDEGGWIVPEVMVRWGHEFGDVNRNIRASFVGTTPVFQVNGVREDRDTLQLRAGVAAYTARDFNIDISYNAELGDRTENHAGVARAVWKFD